MNLMNGEVSQEEKKSRCRSPEVKKGNLAGPGQYSVQEAMKS